MHDDAVVGIDSEASDVAHHVRGKFACKSAAVRISPQEFSAFAAVCEANDTEILFRFILNVFEVFAASGDEKILSFQFLSFKTRRDSADHI